MANDPPRKPHRRLLKAVFVLLLIVAVASVVTIGAVVVPGYLRVKDRIKQIRSDPANSDPRDADTALMALIKTSSIDFRWLRYQEDALFDALDRYLATGYDYQWSREEGDAGSYLNTRMLLRRLLTLDEQAYLGAIRRANLRPIAFRTMLEVGRSDVLADRRVFKLDARTGTIMATMSYGGEGTAIDAAGRVIVEWAFLDGVPLSGVRVHTTRQSERTLPLGRDEAALPVFPPIDDPAWQAPRDYSGAGASVELRPGESMAIWDVDEEIDLLAILRVVEVDPAKVARVEWRIERGHSRLAATSSRR